MNLFIVLSVLACFASFNAEEDSSIKLSLNVCIIHQQKSHNIDQNGHYYFDIILRHFILKRSKGTS